jgi:hypothetical protein
MPLRNTYWKCAFVSANNAESRVPWPWTVRLARGERLACSMRCVAISSFANVCCLLFYSSTLCETQTRHHSADGTTRGRVSRPAAGPCSSPAHGHAWRRQSTIPQFIVFVVVSTAIRPVVIVVLVVCCCSCGVGASCQLGARHDQSDGRRPFPFSHAAPVDGDLCGRARLRPIAAAPCDVQYAARDGTSLVRCRFATTAAATLYVERQCRRRTSAPKRWQCQRRPWP